MDDQEAVRDGSGIARLQVARRRLFASAVMVAAGTAIVALVVDEPSFGGVAVPLWFIGGMLCGAGLFAPFKLTAYGAALGFVVQAVLFVVMYLHVLRALNGLSG